MWNAKDYEQHSSAQQKWARKLITKLDLQGHEQILDLGCGDGKVTAELARLVPEGSVTGIDQSETMINLARTRYPATQFPNLIFERMDARQLTFQNQFDVVFSNAVLHWIDDHRAVLQGIRAGLCPRSRVLLQMGGKGNASGILKAVNTVIQQPQWGHFFETFVFPYYFYDPSEYHQWLPQAGLDPRRVELIPKEMTHNGPTGLAGWIRTTWFPYIQCVPEEQRERLVSEIVAQYLQTHPVCAQGLTHVAMIRLEVEAHKP